MSDWPDAEPTDLPREKAGGRVVVLVLLGLVLLLGAGYAAAYFAADDRVPRGTTVAGIDIGGQTRDGAQRTLSEGLDDLVDRPIPARVDGDAVAVAPAEAGLAVDVEASVDAAGAQHSWSPSWLWRYFTGGDELDPVVTVDDTRMTAFLDALAEEHGRPARDGAVSFDGTQVKVRQALTGQRIDPASARAALTDAFLGDADSVELPLVTDLPEIDGDDVQTAVDDFANPAVSGPVTLVFGSAKVVLTPAEFTAALSLEPVDGTLVPQADKRVLSDLVDQSISGDGAPVDATVALVDGVPEVVPARPGVKYQPGDVAEVLLDLVARAPGEREGEVASTVARPEFTTADARKLEITEKVSTFTTYFPYAEYRNINIGRAAELVNGTVLKPGETFSLNDVVGERTRENGFTEGFIISNGIFKEDLGGGVSQMATTTFNAMFFAGLKDIEHKPHSFYIDRYPVGREATVAWGAVDLRFENDTPYGVLIQAGVSPSTPSSSGVVTVSMWSTKYWDITTKTGERYNFTEPATRTLDTEDCYPNEGYGGFEIDIWRYFRRPGDPTLVRSEKMHTTYIPSDTVICKPPPKTP